MLNWCRDKVVNHSFVDRMYPVINTYYILLTSQRGFNTMRPRQNGCHFADNIFKYIFLNKNVLIPIEISLKFVPQGPINNIPSLVQIMAWHRPGDKPLSEPMMVSLLTDVCVSRPQWVKDNWQRIEATHAYDLLSWYFCRSISERTFAHNYHCHYTLNIL